MCPPLAFITTLILLYMEFTSALIFLIGMFSHSSSNAVRNCPRVSGVFRRLLTRLSSSSHKCSNGDKSGLYDGQSSGTLLSPRTTKLWRGYRVCPVRMYVRSFVCSPFVIALATSFIIQFQYNFTQVLGMTIPRISSRFSVIGSRSRSQ